jgi:hypothetical protein
VSPQEIAERYFAAMCAQDLEALLALFDEAGVIVWPDGRRIEGREAIRETYTWLFRNPTNNPVPGPLMLGPESFATEVHSRLPDGTERRTLNVFRLAPSGLVARMDSYRQD